MLQSAGEGGTRSFFFFFFFFFFFPPPPPFFLGGGGREGVAKGVGEGRGARYVQSLCNLKIKITEGGWKCKQMVGCKKTTTTTKMGGGGGKRERES